MGLHNKGHDRPSAIPVVWHFLASYYKMGMSDIWCKGVNPPARTTKPREKSNSATLLPYFQTIFHHISRILARHNIMHAGLPTRKFTNFICPVR